MQVVSFADFEAGQTFRGPGRTLTETDHGMFIMLVGDWHAIHSDEEYAKTTPLGRRVMHGTFGVASAMGMQHAIMDFTDPIVGALGLDEWRFAELLFVGDTIHVEVEILGKRVTSRGDCGIVQRRIRLINQHGKVVQEGRSEIMLRIG